MSEIIQLYYDCGCVYYIREDQKGVETHLLCQNHYGNLMKGKKINELLRNKK